MKQILLGALILLILINCQNKEVESPIVQQENIIEFGRIDSIHSDILDETRKIWIHLPESAKGDPDNKTRFPVLYLLDGPAHFYSVSGLIKQLSTSNGNTILPEMIVVAIPNTDRSRDLTPTHADMDFFSGDSIQYASGGGDKFLEFVEKDLIPTIEKNYPASTYRTFIGHSFGGLSVINALVTRPHLFDNYVAIDPSLWWDDHAFANFADSVLRENVFEGKSLFIGVANTMSEGMDIERVRSDTLKNNAHIKSILKFVHSIESYSDDGLNFNWKYYEEDDHGSIPLISTYEALRSLFDWYKFGGMPRFFDPNTTKEELIKLVNDHYANVSTHFGYPVIPPENFINSMGYGLLNLGMPQKASAFFEMNIQNYPDNSNVYDSMGDCFLALKDTITAIDFFNKSLEYAKNEYTLEKLEKIK